MYNKNLLNYNMDQCNAVNFIFNRGTEKHNSGHFVFVEKKDDDIFSLLSGISDGRCALKSTHECGYMLPYDIKCKLEKEIGTLAVTYHKDEKFKDDYILCLKQNDSYYYKLGKISPGYTYFYACPEVPEFCLVMFKESFYKEYLDKEVKIKFKSTGSQKLDLIQEISDNCSSGFALFNILCCKKYEIDDYRKKGRDIEELKKVLGEKRKCGDEKSEQLQKKSKGNEENKSVPTKYYFNPSHCNLISKHFDKLVPVKYACASTCMYKDPSELNEKNNKIVIMIQSGLIKGCEAHERYGFRLLESVYTYGEYKLGKKLDRRKQYYIKLKLKGYGNVEYLNFYEEYPSNKK